MMVQQIVPNITDKNGQWYTKMKDNECEMSINSHDETKLEEDKEKQKSQPTPSILNKEGEEQKWAFKRCLIKTSIVVYSLIILFLLYQFLVLR